MRRRIRFDRGIDYWCDIEAESRIVWKIPREEAMRLPWVREASGPAGIRSKLYNLVAYAVGRGNRTTRHWYLMPQDLEVYAKLGTCASEGVYPPSITAGKESEPAQPYVHKEANK